MRSTSNQPSEHPLKVYHHLYLRWSSGVGRALNRHRTTEFEEDTKNTAFVANSGAFEHIGPHMQNVGAWGTAQQVDRSIETIALDLNRNRGSLLAALHNPLSVVENVNDLSGDSYGQWAAWCWVTEAAWRALHPLHRPSEHQLTDTEITLYTPVAARQRFIALGDVFRHGYEEDEDKREDHQDVVERLFGRGARDQLYTRARDARKEWASFLGRHESLTAFDQAEWHELESETDLLLFERTDPASARLGSPLAIHNNRWLKDLKAWGRFTREDRRFATTLMETHHLPRFRLGRAAQASLRMTKCPKLAWSWAAVTASVALGTAFLAFFAFTLFPPFPPDGTAMWAAPATVALGVLGVAAFGRLWAMPWMLRVPAAAAIGLLMLTAMNPAWWHAAFAGTGVSKDVPSSWSGPHPLWVALLLATAAFAYLLVNVRNTGVSGWVALGRALVVWVVSAVHSVLVALFGLSWVVPLFSEDGDVFVAVWSGHPAAATIALFQASAWCLVAGVFSQILWDDRPLTAPLAHAHWRAEER